MKQMKKEAIEEGFEEGRQEGRQEGMQEGIKKGKREGEKKEKIETAKRMLNENLPINIIIKATELTKEEIENIRNQGFN